MDERRKDFYFNNTMPNLKGNQVFPGQDCKGTVKPPLGGQKECLFGDQTDVAVQGWGGDLEQQLLGESPVSFMVTHGGGGGGAEAGQFGS